MLRVPQFKPQYSTQMNKLATQHWKAMNIRLGSGLHGLKSRASRNRAGCSHIAQQLHNLVTRPYSKLSCQYRNRGCVPEQGCQTGLKLAWSVSWLPGSINTVLSSSTILLWTPCMCEPAVHAAQLACMVEDTQLPACSAAVDV